MKQKALQALRVALSLVVVLAAGGSQQDGLSILVQQIRTVGPRQWLGLVAGTAVPGAFVIPSLTGQIARLLPGRAIAVAASGVRPAHTA
jgi:hypothetical protein